MTALSNSFEGGTNGSSITAGTSGGASGNAFDGLTGTGQTWDNAHVAHGSLAYKDVQATGGTQGNLAWSTSLGAPATTADLYIRYYLYITANPSANDYFCRFAFGGTTGGTHLAGFGLDSSGHAALYDTAASTSPKAVSTATVPLNQWIRIEGHCGALSATTGLLEMRVWFSMDSSGTPDISISSGVANTGTTAVTNLAFGTEKPSTGYTSWFDDVGFSTVTWIGPVTGAGPAVVASAAAVSAAAATVIAGSSGGAVTLRSSTLQPYGNHSSPGVIAPAGVLAGDVLVLLFVVYDGSGGPTTPGVPAPWLPFPGTTSGVIATKSPFGGGGATMRLFGYYKVSNGTEPAGWIISGTSFNSAFWCGAYIGADNGTPIAPTITSNSGTNTGSGVASTALSVTPTVNGSQVVVVGGDNGDFSNAVSIPGTTPTFTTETPSPVVLTIFDGLLSTAGATGNKTFNNNSASGNDWLNAMFVINATIPGGFGAVTAASRSAASAIITRPGPAPLSAPSASAQSAASALLTTGTPLTFQGVSLGPMLATNVPPTGYVRALPGIVQSEWSYINGFVTYLATPSGDPVTLCVDSSGNLVAYQDPLQPGQLVPASSVAAPPLVTNIVTPIARAVSAAAATITIPVATNVVVATAQSISAASAALYAPGPAFLTPVARGVSAATGPITTPGPPMVGTFTDNFPGTSLNTTTNWQITTGSPTVASNKLSMIQGATYTQIIALNGYSLIASQIVLKVTPPASDNGSRESEMHFALSGVGVGVIVGDGNLIIPYYWDSTGAQHRIPTSVGHTGPVWVRIREASGTVYWDHSDDGSNWTTDWSVLNPCAPSTALQYAYLSLTAGYWNVETAGIATIYEHLNIVPAPMTASAAGVSAASATVTAPTVGGAVALRSSSHLGYGSHTNPSMPAPASIVNGDVLLLVGVVYGAPASPVIAPTGFTAVPGSTTVTGAAGGVLINDTNFNGSGDNVVVYAWTKVAASESGPYAIAQSAAGSGDFWMGCYSGVDHTTPVLSGWTGNQGLGSTSTALSVTSTLNNSGIVVISGDNGNNANPLSISGTTPTFTSEIAAPVVLGVLDGILATAGATGNKTFTNNANSTSGWVAAMLVLNS